MELVSQHFPFPFMGSGDNYLLLFANTQILKVFECNLVHIVDMRNWVASCVHLHIFPIMVDERFKLLSLRRQTVNLLQPHTLMILWVVMTPSYTAYV